MRRSIILILLTTCCINAARHSSTMRVADRVRLLKYNIRNSLRHPSESDPEPAPAYYESDENAPILPILEHDELKKGDKFKLRRVKTKPTTKVVLRTVTVKSVKPKIQRVQPNEKVTAISKSLTLPSVPTLEQPLEIFYRKSYGPPTSFDTPLEWVHCSEHITPYLKGVKNELTKPRKIQPEDHVVHRLENLLSINITRMSRSEKKSIMFQFSKVKIRLYSWGPVALRLLLKKIAKNYAKSERLDFQVLRRGMKNLINTLNADLSNITRLLVETKIFRPPCIYTNEQGSSKFVQGSTMSMPSLRTPDNPVSMECLRRDQNDACL